MKIDLQRYGPFLRRRLFLTVITLWGLATLAFVMTKMIPGDEAQVAAGPDAAPQQVELIRERLGLNAPPVEQYLSFLGRLLHGDLGTSVTTSQPVTADLALLLPGSIELVLVAMLLNLLVAIPSATLAAMKRDLIPDKVSRVLAVIAGGLPIFWLALVLQYLFGTVWRILPISGQNAFGMAVTPITGMPALDALISGNPSAFVDALAHLILPAVALAAVFASQIFRAMRTSLLSVLSADFISVVRAKGASERRILVRHALPNGLHPVLTMAGTQLTDMIGAVVLVETVFARPGVGTYLANAVAQKDTFAVIGTVLFVGIAVCLINLAIDLLQMVIDPRLSST
jgi:peptide/nickel transport system permease protein